MESNLKLQNNRTWYVIGCALIGIDDLECTTVKPVLSGLSKIDKTKVLKTDGNLVQVESIAECSIGAFCNTFDLN